MTVARLDQELTLDEEAEWFEFLAIQNEQQKKAMDGAKASAAGRSKGRRR